MADLGIKHQYTLSQLNSLQIKEDRKNKTKHLKRKSYDGKTVTEA